MASNWPNNLINYGVSVSITSTYAIKKIDPTFSKKTLNDQHVEHTLFQQNHSHLFGFVRFRFQEFLRSGCV
jgi:hypothetical protein